MTASAPRSAGSNNPTIVNYRSAFKQYDIGG